jgi:adenylate kinase family enzyme
LGAARAEASEDMSMKKVAIFGNAGGGKSTLSRRLAEITGLPLYILDIIQFRGGIETCRDFAAKCEHRAKEKEVARDLPSLPDSFGWMEGT